MKFAAQLVTYSCAHVQRELLTERLACSAGPELISISDSRKAGSDYEEDVGCRSGNIAAILIGAFLPIFIESDRMAAADAEVIRRRSPPLQKISAIEIDPINLPS